MNVRQFLKTTSLTCLVLSVALGACTTRVAAPVSDRDATEMVPPAPRVAQPGHYIVQPGDTLHKIAQQHGVTLAELTEWNPLAEESTYVYIEEKNHLTQEFNYAIYTLTGFGPPNVMIDGIDTGVRDVESNGQSLSELLSELAANATSHGDFVRQVAKLTNALKKAGVITSKEKEIIMEAAAESSVGK